MTQPHPPGWYPDPQVPKTIRYWDGHQWTAQTRRVETKKSNNWKWLLGVLAILVVIGVVGSVVGDESEDDSADTSSTGTTLVPVETLSPAEQEAQERANSAALEAEASRESQQRAAQLDKSSYQQTDSRTWQLVVKNPDAHIGEKYVVYGYVVQADSAMGSSAIRVQTDGQQVEWYDMDVNTVANAGLASFSEIVEDDLVTMWVEITGSVTYDTTMGGSMTAPEVEVNIIEQYGTTG
ncbi:DUF2510 domain-containing protein [Gordonia sp. LSe1-13]|uniref:DUF2510 domain-containing protein n=1 Tax=Gordonia sesuvii TaxID=3116777 RepID=A0ABU7MFP5_9ACTN|nr:DUF2510 domain-containing protein [Gordonia sp. LSe1-13]